MFKLFCSVSRNFRLSSEAVQKLFFYVFILKKINILIKILTNVIYALLNKQKNSTIKEISQFSQVAFLKQVLTKTRNLLDLTDRHLTEDVCNGLHFVDRHLRSTPEGFKQAVYKFNCLNLTD